MQVRLQGGLVFLFLFLFFGINYGFRSWCVTMSYVIIVTGGFPGRASDTEPTSQSRRHRKLGFNPWVRKIPWRRAWKPTPEFLPRESHGQRSLIYRVTGSTGSQRVGHVWTDLANKHSDWRENIRSLFNRLFRSCLASFHCHLLDCLSLPLCALTMETMEFPLGWTLELPPMFHYS